MAHQESTPTSHDRPIDIGSRRELFVDEFLVERLTGEARLQLHRPIRREIVFRADAPWEGNGSAYQSLFRVDYRGGHHSDSPAWRTASPGESTTPATA